MTLKDREKVTNGQWLTLVCHYSLLRREIRALYQGDHHGFIGLQRFLTEHGVVYFRVASHFAIGGGSGVASGSRK